MSVSSNSSTALALFAVCVLPAFGGLAAQELNSAQGESQISVYGSLPADLSSMAEGPDIGGVISARSGREMQVTSADGSSTMILVVDDTDIRSRGGFLGLDRTRLAADSLLNGLPVTVETVQWEGGLVASEIRFKDDDLEIAEMIRGGTTQRFAEHGMAIEENAAATEALRGRFGDIDRYNIMGMTNVHFDTGEWNLSSNAQNELCAAASQAEATDNALLLVVGYTDSVGSQEYNQELSERRAGRVVNYLQQQCGWEPWRMLTPTGMAEADPLASNDTAEGKAQNRRVSVNILVSKALAGL